MSLAVQFAFRNVFRQRQRSFLNLVMIAGSIISIVIFDGFASHTLTLIENVVVDSQYGHLQVATKKYWDEPSLDHISQKALPDLDKTLAVLNKQKGIRFVSPRLNFYSMVSTENSSVAGQGIGIDPTLETQFLNSVFFEKGVTLSDPVGFQIILGSGLAKRLGAQVGQNATLVAQTWDGSTNALDLSVVGIFRTGLSEIDNNSFYIPFKMSQKLLDTSTSEKLIVRLNNSNDLLKVQVNLDQTLKADGLGTKNWKELANLYRQVVEFYKVQNYFIKTILIILVFLSINNTVGMSIFERIGEIGTMRAFGDTIADVRKQFFIEALILSSIAVLIAIPAAFSIAYFVSALGIPIELPGSSLPARIAVKPSVGSFIYSVVFSYSTVLLAFAIPVQKALKLKISDSLRRNII